MLSTLAFSLTLVSIGCCCRVYSECACIDDDGTIMLSKYGSVLQIAVVMA